MASVKQLPSGNFRALVRKKGFQSMSETFKSEKEAQKWGDAQDRKLEQIRRFGSADTPKGSTFPDFIQKYTEEFGSVKPFGKNKTACLARLSREFKGVLMSDMTKSRINQ